MKESPMSSNRDPADHLTQDQEELRALLRQSEVADLFDPGARDRIGKLISRAVFNPAKPDGGK